MAGRNFGTVLVDTVILIPYRNNGCSYRGRNFAFTLNWWRTNHPKFRIHVGDSLGEFSRSEARNNAARMAGDWDVALFADADTIAHPDAVAQAVHSAANSMQMVVTGDSHMYCDRASSERIHESGVPAFPRPQSFDNTGIYEKPCSGIFAINRDLFNKVGGYVESLTGYGYEDLVFLQMCGIFGAGNNWVPGHINLHLWHPKSARTDATATNKRVWQQLTKYRMRADRDGARRYLATLGHTVP